MKKQLMIMLFGMLLLFSLNFISAVPPFQTSTTADKSILIESPVIETHHANQYFIFHLHPHNSSDGRLIGYGNIGYCAIHIYRPSDGEHIIETNMSRNSNDFDWEYNASAGNFSELGQYAGYMYCQTNTTGDIRGGFFEFAFEVNPTGIGLTTGKAILYGFILSLIGLFLFFSISGIRKAESGVWLVAYICLTYILVYGLIGILYLLANAFLWMTPIMANILYIIWFIMGIGFLPFAIILSLYMLGKEAEATLEQDYMKQGYTRDDARDLSRRTKR
jgi:hypothetical protein